MKTPCKRIHHLGILVDDLSFAESFLVNELGATPTRQISLPESSTEITFFSIGSVEIELIEVSDEAVRQKRLEKGRGASVIEHLAIEVADVDDAVRSLKAGGATFRETAGSEPTDDPKPFETGGTRSVYTTPSTTGGLQLQLIEDFAGSSRISAANAPPEDQQKG